MSRQHHNHLHNNMAVSDILNIISSTLNLFNASVDDSIKSMAAYLQTLLKKIEVDENGNVKVDVANLNLISTIKEKLTSSILTAKYLGAASKFIAGFGIVAGIQDAYYENSEPSATSKALLKAAKDAVIDRISGDGLTENVVNGVIDILRKGITSGAGYANLQNQIFEFIGSVGDPQNSFFVKYVKQVSTDAINQFGRQYAYTASADLGLTWFRYAGSNIQTTRPFCLACTERQYFNIKEIPDLLKGDFPEFAANGGKIYEKYGLPQGMYPETDTGNFHALLGGYNCGHQYRPVSDDIVPEKIKQAFAEKYK